MNYGFRQKLETFNQAIVGNIEVIKVFIGSNFKNSANAKIENLMLNVKQ